MFRDLLEILQETFKKLVSSRLFALAVCFTVMFGILISKLFQLQIIEGENYLNEYIQKTEKVITTAGTRGNIYDRSGNVLAYNELAYVVTIRDTGAYPKNNQKNTMMLQLVHILESHGEKVQGKFEIAMNNNGDMVYTTTSESARKRFLRDLYGLKSPDELDDKDGKYPSNVTAREVFEMKKKVYELDKLKDPLGNPILISDELALQIINIRYTMGFTFYQKYETTPITSYVSDETVADILEHTSELDGVNVEEATIRIYNDSIYFASIIGYTGKVQDDQLESLQAQNDTYEISDIVGRTGMEASLEMELQGKKGSKTMYVDNMGRIMEVTSETEAQAGEDVYLTIDRDLQIGIYNLIEQQLAGVLAAKLVNQDLEANDTTDSSNRVIPVKDAYFQLINNNVLSLKEFGDEDASGVEQQINSKFLSSREQIISNIKNELYSEHPTAMQNLPKDMYSYMSYIYSYLSDPTVGIIMTDNIDMNGSDYLAWKEKVISLREFIYAGIANNWIDTTKLQIESKYSNADDIFSVLVEYVLKNLQEDNKFSKKIYQYLINDEVITGRELCLALYDQEVLPYDQEKINLLQTNGDNYAYTFLVEKISNIELTPAQLALDPCTGGCVVTDVNTGEIRALVTYPSYDNNRLSGTMDSAYYTGLLEDMSNPLYNNATQTIKAPGSTFKPIAAVAALEEHVVTLDEKINCTGLYDVVDPPIKCWIYPWHHGEQILVDGIQNSCNCFFSELGHRLATDESGNYSQDLGIERIRKYATLFGLDHTSGVEITESSPKMTTEDPERSVMGQGTNAYSNVQLSRYVAALANRGTVFKLSLIDKVTDSNGNLIREYAPMVNSKIEIADSTWDAVQVGMRHVIVDGSAKKIFKDLEVDIAGKTGTAQESKSRANHAFFISYAPYSNPDICVTVNIPYGYSSTNAATIAKNVYRFYYGYTDLDYILNTGALDVSNVQIGD